MRDVQRNYRDGDKDFRKGASCEIDMPIRKRIVTEIESTKTTDIFRR